MNFPSKHATPHLLHGTGAMAPDSSAGTRDFLLSNRRPAVGVGREMFDGYNICYFFASSPWTLARGLWSCSMILQDPHRICHLVGDVSALNLKFQA